MIKNKTLNGEKFNYLNWRNKLQQTWQEKFKLNIPEKIGILQIKKRYGKRANRQGARVVKIQREFRYKKSRTKRKEFNPWQNKFQLRDCCTIQSIRMVQDMKWID